MGRTRTRRTTKVTADGNGEERMPDRNGEMVLDGFGDGDPSGAICRGSHRDDATPMVERTVACDEHELLHRLTS
jgi:hypothetical protein